MCLHLEEASLQCLALLHFCSTMSWSSHAVICLCPLDANLVCQKHPGSGSAPRAALCLWQVMKSWDVQEAHRLHHLLPQWEMQLDLWAPYQTPWSWAKGSLWSHDLIKFNIKRKHFKDLWGAQLICHLSILQALLKHTQGQHKAILHPLQG